MDTAIATYSHQSKAGRYRQCYSTVNSTVGAHLVQLKILVHVVRQSPYAAHACVGHMVLTYWILLAVLKFVLS